MPWLPVSARQPLRRGRWTRTPSVVAEEILDAAVQRNGDLV